jgi:hypothetical protein
MCRYFIVFYDARNSKNQSAGNCWVQNEEGAFVNNAATVKNIALANPQFAENDIVITNILELSAKDFNDFLKQ